MDEAIETSVAMALAAMPGPPGTVREAHVSGGVDVSMFGEVSLRIEPGQPMAGHDVSFTLTGLDPWQPVALSFRDPTGRSAEWIAPTETRFAWIDGSPITGQWFHADEEGSLSWTRIGTLDREGTWSVVVAVDGVDYPVEYPVMDLPLPKPESTELGVELRRYRGSVSDTYTSALRACRADHRPPVLPRVDHGRAELRDGHRSHFPDTRPVPGRQWRRSRPH